MIKVRARVSLNSTSLNLLDFWNGLDNLVVRETLTLTL